MLFVSWRSQKLEGKQNEQKGRPKAVAQAPRLCEPAHSCQQKRNLDSDHQQRIRREPAMSTILLVAERAVWAVDTFLTRAILFAWTPTLHHHVDDRGGSNLAVRANADEQTRAQT
jgi:hypothetical protein